MLEITFEQIKNKEFPFDIIKELLINLGYKQKDDKFIGIDKIIYKNIEYLFNDRKLFIGNIELKYFYYIFSLTDFLISKKDDGYKNQYLRLYIDIKLLKKNHLKFFKELIEHYINIQERKFNEEVKKVMNILLEIE